MGRTAKVDWSAVDWVLQDIQLAEEHGVSRERVRQVRSVYGGGVMPDGYRKRTGVTAGQRIVAMETEGKTMAEVARAAGCGKAYAGVALRKAGKKYRLLPKGNARYDWGLLPADWMDRTDKEMATMIGASGPAVVTQWRIRHGLMKQGRRTRSAIRPDTEPVEHRATPVPQGNVPCREKTCLPTFSKAVAYLKGKLKDFVATMSRKLSMKGPKVISLVDVVGMEGQLDKVAAMTAPERAA